MMYAHEATVVVRAPFPVDMLRYDRCHPASPGDVNAIESSLANYPSEAYRVRVQALSRAKEHWTKHRWKSFGAEIVETVARRA